ncbi:hypothetical protein Lesp02_09610 [Lentzea sp. NBRC 105346]|uniref:DUF485 domain-containing protein n=1 Tax=Lentzea sp. NBRC 105346 TaxID=3032205 RepID=UPI0024A4C4D1|nr:DUF485 domain-containing protein [Lentzea sp. NBRC 105346]GLZ28771.1 hypothetical protein Lesp02_09610 [Lentzea sp. NBRC 105346]
MTKALPSPGFATFEDSDHALLLSGDGEPDFRAIQQSEDFQLLRRRIARFVIPATILFLSWYVTFVLLSAYADDFMSTPVFGVINVGLVCGFLQFVTTILITLAYARYARKKLDPQVEAVRGLVADEEML